jgi:uncharacterized repeat protein (TIGR01451 family)
MEIDGKGIKALILVCGLFLSLLVCNGVTASNNTTVNHTNTSKTSKSVNLTVINQKSVSASKNVTKTSYSANSSQLPSYYDLRALGKVAPIKDQGFSGTCWAFAVLGSLESNLLPGEKWNFSENNMKNLLSSAYKDGFDRDANDAGCWEEALAYLSRYSGPVTAAQDPYDEFSTTSPTDLKSVKHVQDAIQIMARNINGQMNNTSIKEAIIKYGAMYSLMVYDESYLNFNTEGYYYNGTGDYNHAIDIVGWDDNYSKTNFLNGAPGDGAFIIKNSWGPSWGDNGYFYVSHYDKYLANSNDNIIFMDAEKTSNYKNIYQYDPLGDVGNYGYGTETAWFSNVFTSKGKELLKAASFYVTQPNTAYNLYVYLNPIGNNPRSGKLMTSISGTMDNAGYYTILLNKFVKLLKNEKFSIVVRVNSPNESAPITIEYPMMGYSSKATASPGQSYISFNGVSWEDMTNVIENANVCLKAFTTNIGTDVSIMTKTSNPNPKLGSIIYYTITVKNNGPIDAFNVLERGYISKQLSLLSYVESSGSYDIKTNKWSIGLLKAGKTATIVLKFLVTGTSNINSTFLVSSSTYDYNLTNNIAVLTGDPNQNNSNHWRYVNSVRSKTWDNVNNTKNSTLPMQNTGAPIIPLLIGFLAIVGGLIYKKK